MTFLYPEALWLLLIMPVLAGVALFGTIRARHTVSAMVGSYRRDEILAAMTIKTFVVSILQGFAFILFIMAAAEPQWGEIAVEDERRGLDLVILVDISNSMLIEDVVPSRIARTRDVIRGVLARFEGVHASLIAFKGSPATLVPMTDDPVAMNLAVSNLSPALLTAPGTDLNRALRAGLQGFPAGSPRHQIILLFSDGGHEEGLDGTTIQLLRTSDIPIWTILTGSSAGGTIPHVGGGVMRDRSNSPVVLPARGDRMQMISELSRGKMFDISEVGIIQRLVADLEQITGRSDILLFRQAGRERYHLFVFAGFILLVIAVLVQSYRWRGGL
jgi:Ca-activated chloride channel family protein